MIKNIIDRTTCIMVQSQIKDRRNLESKTSHAVKKSLIDLSLQIGVSEETVARYFQVGYLCKKCFNLAKKVIKLEDELQQNLRKVKQNISDLDLQQPNTQTGNENQAPECSSSAQIQS